MARIIVILVLVMAVVGAGAYYFLIKPNSETKAPEPQKKVEQVAQVTVTPTSTPLVTTDESINDDMTALEKDLAGLEQSDKELTSELNNL